MSNRKFGDVRRLVGILLLATTWFGVADNAFAKAKYVGQVFAPSGTPLSGATIRVTSDKALVNLYADKEGRKKLANPVTSGPGGVYWFYADNGRYQLRIEHGERGLIDEIDEVYVFDPREPQTVTASSEQAALTLIARGTPTSGNNNPITFARETAKGAEPSGKWRMMVNKRDGSAQSGNFILAYNTDWREGADAANTGWLRREVNGPCVALEIRPYDSGSCRYLVAPAAPAGTPVEFKPVLESVGNKEGQDTSWVQFAGSLLTVGDGLANTRLFHEVKKETVPFALAGALHPAYMDPKAKSVKHVQYGEIRVPDDSPERFGYMRLPSVEGERHPLVIASAGLICRMATAGKAIVRITPGTRVQVGDALVAGKASGFAVVDNKQTDPERIIGWALERSEQSQPGFVLVLLK